MNAELEAGGLDEGTIRTISDRLDEPVWLLDRRLAALEAVSDLELPPVIQTPGRRWTNLAELPLDSLVDPLDASEEKERAHSDDVEIYSLEAAIAERPDLLRDHLGEVVDPTENALTALGTAALSTGTVIYVPEGVTGAEVTVRTTMGARSLSNHTLIITEPSSEVTILERQASSPAGDDRYYGGTVEIVAGENSAVQYGSLQELDRSTTTYTLKRGLATRDARVTWIEANLGAKLTKSSVETRLVGEGSETKIVGAFFGHDRQHIDVASRVWHEAERTTADLVTRGVLDDAARSVYEGVQHVGKEAWHTNSYQRENTLMLSDESEADASPKLIINNHETEASHSATVGQIDREDLFYMTSRGLSPRIATHLLVEGFFVPVMEEIGVEEFREDLEARITGRLA